MAVEERELDELGWTVADSHVVVECALEMMLVDRFLSEYLLAG